MIVGLETGCFAEMITTARLQLQEEVAFIDIGGLQETYFSWSNPVVDVPFSKLDVIAARSFPGTLEDYAHWTRKDGKLVFRQVSHPDRGFTKILVVVGATLACQFQVMEALVDFLGERWFARFGANANISSSPGLFDPFAKDVTLALEVVPRDRIRVVTAHCRQCQQDFEIHVKKALVETATSYPVPMVFAHANHALLLYIDRDFRSRGECIVNISG